MDNRSGGAKTRAQSKSPARGKTAKNPPKSKSPSRQKSPGRSKSPGRPKSPGRSRSPRKTKSPGRSISPGKPQLRGRPKSLKTNVSTKEESPIKVSPVRNISPPKRFTPIISIEKRSLRNSPSIDKLATSFDAFKNEGLGGDVEVLFLDDNIRFKTTTSDVKFGGNLNVGDVRDVKWEDGNYYQARILNLMETERDRSASVAKTTTSTLLSSHGYSIESTLYTRASRRRREGELSITGVNAEGDKILKANNVPLPSQFESKYGKNPKREFGDWPGALIAMLFLPALAIVMQMSCTKAKCIGVNIPSTNWKVYLDPYTAGFYLGFVALQVILSSLPIGRKASYCQVQARLSGFYNALLTLAALGGLYYYGYNVTHVLGKSIAVLTTAILTSVVLAIILFLKGGGDTVIRNENADGNKIYDFFIGREVLPSVGPLNIKALLHRMEFIGILLLDTLYLLKYKETHAAGINSPTLLFVVATHVFYVLDTLWFEEKFMTTFQAQYEGLGYMNVMAAAVWPFLLTLTTRFVFYTGYEAPTYLLVICGITFIIGYFIYRTSNSQKAEFRKNPQHPAFARYETIATIYGKRLLCSGCWGIVRHPNYLGDMLMMWSMAAPCGLAHWLPYIFPALHSLVLIHRTFRVGSRSKSLYGAAWDRYNQIVKYRLVPRIF